MNLSVIRRYQKLGVNGFFMGDNWGLQDRLMIAPASWRQFWKPAYARIFAAAHEAGMLTTLHSCGHIVAILDNLIEIGLDMIHMDQQQNMGLELLGEHFGGRITFFSPVDIQKGMQGSLDEIRPYAADGGPGAGPAGGRLHSPPLQRPQRRRPPARGRGRHVRGVLEDQPRDVRGVKGAGRGGSPFP